MPGPPSRRPFARTRGRAVSTAAGGGHVDATRLGAGQASGSLLRGGHGECQSVSQHVLLSAQKHARQVEKAGGKGSWQRWPQSYGGDWGGDVKGKNKFKDGKGKGKKGKGKGKGKGGWNNWSPENRKKGGEKAKKGEGET